MQELADRSTRSFGMRERERMPCVLKDDPMLRACQWDDAVPRPMDREDRAIDMFDTWPAHEHPAELTDLRCREIRGHRDQASLRRRRQRREAPAHQRRPRAQVEYEVRCEAAESFHPSIQPRQTSRFKAGPEQDQPGDRTLPGDLRSDHPAKGGSADDVRGADAKPLRDSEGILRKPFSRSRLEMIGCEDFDPRNPDRLHEAAVPGHSAQ